MTSSNHVLLISDEDNGRTRKKSTSSSLDSWEGLGLGETSEFEVSKIRRPSSSTKQLNFQSRAFQPISTPFSGKMLSDENHKSILSSRNVNAHRNIPHSKQQKSETVKTIDPESVYDSRISSIQDYRKRNHMLWYTDPVANESPGTSKPATCMQQSNQRYVPASHLLKADRVPMCRTSDIDELSVSRIPSVGRVTEPTSDSAKKFYQKSIQQAPTVDQTEKMKIKLMSVWNNVKYGWTVRTKTSFNCISPVYLLGQVYKDNHTGEPHHHGESSYEKFLLDFSSRIWLTYRRDFPILEGSPLTTDCGWGCMLRSGQMMLAQALITHFLGRAWRLIGVHQTEMSERLHRMILRWFGDLPFEWCPFSLHRLVAMGSNLGKKAGDWYGPASVAYILKQAMELAANENPPLDDLCVYVAQDCTVYKQDVIEMCTRPNRIQKIPDMNVIRNSPLVPPLRQKLPVALNPQIIDWKDVLQDQNGSHTDLNSPRSIPLYGSRDFQSPPKSPLSRTWSNSFLAGERSPLPSMGQSSIPLGTSLDCVDAPRDRWRSLVVLVPVRLGGERLNKLYFPCINKLLELECSIGIIGGKPRHSLYFVGYQDDKLIYLDPHYCQEMIDVRQPNFQTESFQCSDPRKIPIMKMDPSCTIGFYFRTRDDFEKFTETVEPLLSSGDGRSDYPIFIISPDGSANSAHELSGPGFTNDMERSDLEATSYLDGDDFVLL